MKTKDIPNTPPSAWQPETDTIRCAILGKAQEELHELGKEIARAQAMGLDGINPNGESVRDALADELDDAEVLINIMRAKFNIPRNTKRQRAKRDYQEAWYSMLVVKK